MRTCSSTCVALLACVASLASPAGAQGAALRTGSGTPSQSLHEPSTADVIWLALDRDEKHVVYLADRVVDGQPRLYAVRPNGGNSLELSAPFESGRAGLSDFKISPDGKRVLYLADHEARARYELYSVGIDGGAVVKISRPQLTGSINRSAYTITPDSERVVFLDGQSKLFSAPLAGGSHVDLSRSLRGIPLQGFRVTADGSTVVFEGRSGSTGPFRFFSVPVDGSAAPLEIGVFPLTSGYLPLEVTPDSSTVVYGDGQGGLFSVPVAGGTPPIRLNGALAGSGIQSWKLRLDGASVAYVSNEARLDANDLFVVPVDGSASATQVGASIAGQFIFNFEPAASGRIAFVTNPSATDHYDLLSGAATAGAPVPLNDPGDNLVLLGSAAGVPLLVNTPGGTRSIFAAGTGPDVSALFSAPSDGSAPAVELAPLIDSWIPVHTFPSIDGRAAELLFDVRRQRVVFGAVSGEDGPLQLFSVPIDGSAAAVRLNDDFTSGSPGVRYFVLAPRIGRVFFAADQLEAGVTEIFSVPIDGSKAPRRIVNL